MQQYMDPKTWQGSFLQWARGCQTVVCRQGNGEMKRSQNHRMVEIGRDLWRSSCPTPCSSRATYGQLPRTMSRWLFNIPRRETSPLWAACASAWSTSQWKKVFLMFRENLLCCGHCLWSCHWAPLERASLHLVYALPSDFWDTAGQERFQSMHASYYHKAHACIMVFDVQRKVTYKNLNSWYKELREFRPEIPCVVVANKIDADMKVTQKSFNFARKFSLPFYFVSAADGTNVVKLFNDAIKLAIAYKQNSGDFMDEVMRELEVGRGEVVTL
ncbi:uncharacterized protein LOC142078291 isoform X2 [Calonectris borealis]|uniref:uncharacterized protein LOC142078291 isoform X2 n=2 Tax=Calonectris borealis TaxID=1323832 RepID=UPI003F4B0805